VRWEEPRCLLCNGNRGSVLVEAPDLLQGPAGLWFAVTQCQDCGLCYTGPRPAADAIGPFYPRPGPGEGRPRRPPWCAPLRPAGWAAGRGGGGGRSGDVGWGGGAFRERVRRRGGQAPGRAPSGEAARGARRERGLAALVGSLPHPDLGEESFDLITMRHSLE